MAGSGLAPIPLAGAARKNLRVLERGKTLDLDAAPGKVHNARGFRLRLAHIRVRKQKRESPVIVTGASPVMRFPSCFSRESTEGEPTSRTILGQGWGKQKKAPDVAQISRRLPGARFAAKLPKGSRVDVSRPRPFHAMVAHRDPSRGKEKRNGRQAGWRFVS